MTQGLTASELDDLIQKRIEQQSGHCYGRMKDMDDSLTGVKLSVDHLTKTVNNVDKAVALSNQRWSFFPILAGVLGALGTIVGIVGGLLALLK